MDGARRVGVLRVEERIDKGRGGSACQCVRGRGYLVAFLDENASDGCRETPSRDRLHVTM